MHNICMLINGNESCNKIANGFEYNKKPIKSNNYP